MLGVFLVLGFIIGAGLLGRLIFLAIFDLFIKPEDDYTSYKPPTIIDKSVHHHYHDNRTVNLINTKEPVVTIKKESNTSDNVDLE
ncbi:hypothetical protein DHD32_01160 [Arenibacter sp. TNZ]|nr:hypothetical protein [Arenibacter sp. TNZ]